MIKLFRVAIFPILRKKVAHFFVKIIRVQKKNNQTSQKIVSKDNDHL